MKGLLSVAVALAVCGCASNDRISLVADQTQQALTRDGVPALVSSKRQVVMLRPASAVVQSRGRPTFIVAVYNPGKRPVEFHAAGISAQLNSASGPVSIHVYSYEELVGEVQRKQRWAAFGAALQGVGASMAAANAGYTRTTGLYSGNTYGRYSGALNGTYSASTTGTFSATTYDSGRAYVAQQYAAAQTAANFAAIEAQGKQALDSLQDSILKDNTVLPGEWVGGVVVLDAPSKSGDGTATYRIDVSLPGEVHSFVVSQAKV
jgi:hypothetical protein